MSRNILIQCIRRSYPSSYPGKALSGPAVIKSLLLAVSLAALAFLSACSNSVSTNGVKCPGGTGNYTNASLPAGSQWTYILSGTITSNGLTPAAYTEAGVFTADGNGNISGTDDFFGASSGQYSISSNGTGSMTVVLPNVTLSWGITLSSTNPGSFYLIEADNFANAAGTATQQTASALATTPSGTFVFRTHITATGTSLGGSMATVGVMTVTNGTVTGTEDKLIGGQLSSQLTLTGSLAAPDNTGRGVATLTESSGRTLHYEYYVIDANTFQLFEIDTGIVGLGRAELQSGGPFTNSSLTAGAGFAFGSQGDTPLALANLVPGGVNTAGAITVNGAGNITAGSYDSVQDATVNSNIALTGTYAADASGNGRYAVSLTTSASTAISEIAYFVSPSRAFFLVNDSTKVEDGTLDQQSKSSFANSDLNGQFAFVMGGNDTTDFVDRTGVLQADGTGILNLAELLNRTGIVTVPGCLPGTYTVGTNGRVSGSVNTVSTNFIFYMVSGSKAYLLQADPGVQISGGMAQQGTAVVDPPGIF